MKKYYKALSGKLKMGGYFIHPFWRDMVYWEVGYGYLPYVPLSNLSAEVDDWLVKEKHIGEKIGEDRYNRILEHEITDYLNKHWTWKE